MALIWLEKKCVNLGGFDTEKAAHGAYAARAGRRCTLESGSYSPVETAHQQAKKAIADKNFPTWLKQRKTKKSSPFSVWFYPFIDVCAICHFQTTGTKNNCFFLDVKTMY